MPMRRENVAAALKYLQDKANLRQRVERATSLDPQEQDLADIAVETAASFVPGVGQALAARDVERARRADDPAGMAMATMGAIPGGRLAGLLKRYDPVMQQLDVYHGTPHRFPATEANPLGEFDASKIGTGEGAQAYGHGIYLAEAENVGRDYAQSLSQRSPNRVQLDNTPIKGDTIFSRAIEKLGTQGKEAALKDLDDSIRRNETYAPDMAELYRDVRRQISEIDPKKVNVNQGTLYKADLPDEMIDRMLDWDKPLSEQHPEVQRIIGEEIKRIGGSAHTGEQAYRELMFEARMGGKKSASGVMKSNIEALEASKRLQELGIPGIKYLDAGSRGQGGSGTRNFVVFPGEEKKVRILQRK